MAAEQIEQGIRIGEWLTVAATVAGPILAVQAQKWVERARERTGRKEWVFQTLMATRSTRLSPEHVRALNMIELAFYGTRLFGRWSQTAPDREVIAGWREYHDHFNSAPEDASPEDIRQWNAAGTEIFVNLLEKMAVALHYEFDRVQIKKGWYSPLAHGKIEADQEAIRVGVTNLLSGQIALKMEVTNLKEIPQG
jgi:hypothetical protein